jgi:hypothetical protein
MSLLG